MNHEQFLDFKEEMKVHIEDVVQRKVNGKIDTIGRKLDDFIVRAEPAVKVFENLTWARKAIIGIIVFVGAVATAMTALQSLLGYLKK